MAGLSAADAFRVSDGLRLSFSTTRRPPPLTLFPYTTLFRSIREDGRAVAVRLSEDQRRARARAHDRGGPHDGGDAPRDRKSTRLNSSHGYISYAVFCLKKKRRSGLPRRR